MCSQAFDLAFVNSCSGVHAAEGFGSQQCCNIEASLQLLLQGSRTSVINKKVLLTIKNVKVTRLTVPLTLILAVLILFLENFFFVFFKRMIKISSYHSFLKLECQN